MRDGNEPRVNPPRKHGQRWRIRIDTGNRRRGNKRTSRYVSFATRSAADAYYEAARGETDGVTLEKAVSTFLEKMRLRGLRPTSVESAEDRLLLVLDLGVNGSKPVRWLRDRGIELYDRAQVDHAPDTHRNALAVGKAFGAFCVKQRWLRDNPFADIEGVGRRRRGKPQLGVDEARKLTATCLAAGAAPGPVAVLATLLLGPRASEVIERDVRDLDDGGRLLWIRESKTDAGKRAVEVPEVLQPLLLALSKDRIAGAPLFWKQDGQRPTRHWVRDQCTKFCKLAGVPPTTAHGMRGTHGSIARRGGATAELVAAQLGHASTHVTNSAYIQRRASQAADATAVAEALGPRGGTRDPDVDPNPA